MMSAKVFSDIEIVCSIVIVNWRSYDYLVGCIASIRNSVSCAHEIIIVDNDSGDEERSLLGRLEDVHLILNPSNVGFAAANNQGFRIARGRFIFMLNPDTKLLEMALQKMINFLLAREDIYAVGPKLFYSEKRDYHPSIKTFMTPLNQLLQLLPLSGFLISKKRDLFFDIQKTRRVGCVIGAAILFRKEVFDKIGFLSEDFFIYAEEDDFCKRMQRADLLLYYFPDAEVIHYGGKSQGKSSTAKNIYLWRSKILYLDKYFGPWNVRLHLAAIMVLLALKKHLLGKKDGDAVIGILRERVIAGSLR